MNIINFIERYKDELHIPFKRFLEWNFIQHGDWKREFLDKPELNPEVLTELKLSYFEVSLELIEKEDFDKILELFLIHDLEIITAKDERQLALLISSATDKLNKIDTSSKLELALNYQYAVLDFILHNALYSDKNEYFTEVLKILSEKLEEIDNDKVNDYIELVKQKIYSLTG